VEDVAAHLAETIRARPERLTTLAQRVPEADYAPDELEQLLRGFEQMLLEDLDGQGHTARDLYLETAIPAVVASGRTPAMLASGITRFGILLSSDIAADLDRERRAEGIAWLADFFARFCSDVTETAVREAST